MVEPLHSLNTAIPEEQPQHSLEVDPFNKPVPTVVATGRAYKANFAMPDPNRSYEEVYRDLVTGREKQLREQYATQVDYQKSLALQRAISEVGQKTGRPLTNADIQEITNRFQRATDPDSVIEEQYADKYVSQLDSAGFMGETIFTKGRELIPQETEETLALGRMTATKAEIARTWAENARAAVEDQTWFGWGLDQGKMFSQIYQEIKLRGQVKGGGFVEGGFLGSNLEAQTLRLLQMPLPAFKAEFKRIMDGLIKDNPTAAVMFASAVLGQSTEEKFLNNVFTPLLLTGVATAAKVGTKGIRATKEAVEINKAIKTAAKQQVESLKEPPSPAAAAEATGDIAGAAVKQQAEVVVKNLRGFTDPLKETQEAMSNIFKSSEDATKVNAGNFRQEFVNRLVETSVSAKNKLTDVINTMLKLERLPAILKSEEALKEIFENMKGDYPGLQNTIFSVSNFRKDPGSTVYYADLNFGGADGKLFSSLRKAEKYANDKGFKGQIVEQKGVGFYIRVPHAFNETDDVVRKWIINTNETKTPDSIVNAFGGILGSLRTPEETLSYHQRLNRKTATYTTSKLLKLLEEQAEDLNKLKRWSNVPYSSRKKKWKEWTDVVDKAKGEKDPATGETGYLFKSPQEFSSFFRQHRNRAPDEQEIAAYFSYARLEETKDFLIKRGKFKNLSRSGARTFELSVLDIANENKTFIPTINRIIQGNKLRELPRGDTIYILGNDIKDSKILDADKIAPNSAYGKKLADDIKTGKLIAIELTNPGEYPLEGFGKATNRERIRYVIANPNTVERNLSWNDVKVRRSADYDYDHYVSQAIIKHDPITGKRWYEGDMNISGFNIGAMGRDVAKRLDNIRLLLKAGKLTEARAASEGLPMEYEEIRSWFFPSIGRTPHLSLDEPIQLVPKGRQIVDLNISLKERNDTYTDANGKVHKNAFRDGTREGYGRHLEGKPDPYDIFTLRNEGTKANPLYKVEPVTHVSPITSIHRSLKKAVNSTVMDDYKIFSVETWIKEAEDLLDVPSKKALWDAPYYYFHNPKWKSGDSIRINNLQTSRMAIQQFMGQYNMLDTIAHDMTQKLYDSIYERAGANTKYALAPNWTLPTLRDPFSFIRAATFHAKIGLFALPQLMVQLQTYTAIFGIAGVKYAGPGARAALLHQWSRINKNPEIIDALDKYAGKLQLPGSSKWLPGQFREAMEALDRTGFANVQGEYILRDNPMSYDILYGPGHTFLDWGSMPFREGERHVRLGAWYTAYREFRDFKPHGRLTEADTRTILERADILSINMSRASASQLHRGIMSIPTQFLAYQLRMAELFFGKRLDGNEKFRLLMTNAAFYGVPAAFGVTGLPVGDWLHQKMRENGYQVGKSYVESAMMEGIPALLLALTTGNWYNFQERYSLQGFEQLREAWRSDRTMWDIISGAAGSSLVNTLGAFDPFIRSMVSAIQDDDEFFKLKMDDAVDLFKEVSSVNNTWKLGTAIATGRWLSKKEAYIADVDTGNAIFMYLSGLGPQDTVEMNLQSQTMKSERERMNWLEKQAIREIRRGLQSEDPDQYKDYTRRAFKYLHQGGYPREDIGKVISLALKGYEKLPDKIGRDFFTKHVPEYRKGIAEDAYPQWLKTRERQ